MNSRGIAAVARRVGFALLIIAALTTLVTLCWGKVSATYRSLPPLLGPSVRPAELLTRASGSRDTGTTSTAAPYIETFPGDDGSYAAPHVTPRVVNPGGVIKVEVLVNDAPTHSSAWVSHVWLQVKDPDPRVIDTLNIDNIYGTEVNDYKNTDPDDPTKNAQDVSTILPTEFHTFNPVTNVYTDVTKAESHPGYYARAGHATLFTDEDTGYPEVPVHWLEMFDDGDPAHGDVTAGDGIYTCLWTTPGFNSDFYFDIITEDGQTIKQDGAKNWHGARRRFDNVAGCSTKDTFTPSKNILFVDDYLDGQRALTLYRNLADVPPYAVYLNSPYFFIDNLVKQSSSYGDLYSRTSPFVPPDSYSDTIFKGADIWRVLCRGPVEQSVLDAYLPTVVPNYIDPDDGRTPVSTPVRHADKVVVWASHANLVRDFTGNILRIPEGATLLDTSVQNKLQAFADQGGRLFVISSTLPRYSNEFSNTLRETLGATYAGGTFSNTVVTPNEYNQTPQFVYDDTANVYWYGASLPSPYWNPRLNAKLPRNANPSQAPALSATAGAVPRPSWGFLYQSPIGPMGPGAQTAFYAREVDDGAGGVNRFGIAVQNIRTSMTTDITTRTVYWAFGYEHLSAFYRPKPAIDTCEWLTDAHIEGTIRNQFNVGIPGAMVVISQYIRGETPDDYYRGDDLVAVLTDGTGKYIIQGIPPNKAYVITILASGQQIFQGALSARGGMKTIYDKKLTGDASTAGLHGFITQNGSPVNGATVTAAMLGGADYVDATDATGYYEFPSLPVGEFVLTASKAPFPDGTSRVILLSNDDKRVDIELVPLSDQPGKLHGKVVQAGGNGLPVPGASVRLRSAGELVAATTTNLNGVYSFDVADDGEYVIEVVATGFAVYTSPTIFYLAATGATANASLESLSGGYSPATITCYVYQGDSSGVVSDATVEVKVGSDVVDAFTGMGMITLSLNPGTYQFVASAPGYRTASLLVNVTPGIPQTVALRLYDLLHLNSGTMMFSLPGDYGGQLLKDLLNVAPSLLQLATYDVNAPDLYARETGTTATVVTGKGYWLHLDTAEAALTDDGTPVDTSERYPVQLRAGWNMIGNPFPFNVELSECRVRQGANEYSWGVAVYGNPPIIDGTLYTWTGDMNTYLLSTILRPYMGYWIRAHSDCTLLVSNTPSVRSAAPSRVRRVPTQSDWQVRLEARAGNVRDVDNYLGMAANATTSGYSRGLDYPEPPQPYGNYVRLAFPHAEWGVYAGDYTTDIEKPASGARSWTFRVDTNQTDMDVAIKWPDLTTQLPANYQAILTDLQTQQRCYLNTTSQYVFRSGPQGASRLFSMEISPRTGSLLVTGVRGVRSGARANSTIIFNLTQAAQVKISIRNQTGRLVRSLTSGLSATTGMNTVMWDGRDDAGRMVPRGSYLCEVQASDGIGRSARGTGVILLLTQQ
ncbi:MAG: carboxypeptidase regulatory-like domain-containing protein [Armatimonadota bacterium]